MAPLKRCAYCGRQRPTRKVLNEDLEPIEACEECIELRRVGDDE